MGFRRYVVERAPVIGNEVPRIESVEQSERISTGEVTFPEPWLPPRSVTYGKQGQVETSLPLSEMFFHHRPTGVGQCRVAGKETGCRIGIKKVHICRPAPPVHTVAMTFVRRFGCTNEKGSRFYLFPGSDPSRFPVAEAVEPLRDCRGCKDGNAVGKAIQRVERKVIGVGMGNENGIQLRQLVQQYSWCTDPRQELSECRIEIGIGKNDLPAHLN